MELVDSLDRDEPLIYRRATRIHARENQVVAEMEDDFHHFRICLSHDGLVITRVVGESIRFPWSTCGHESEKKIQELEGLGLESLYTQLSSQERFTHCTHMFDLVQLAINHALTAQSTRLYQAAVTLTPALGAFQAELLRDKSGLFLWDIEHGGITGPAPFSGLKVGDLSAWAHQHQPAEMVEAVLILQRAIHVSMGKIFDWSSAEKASEMNLPPTCHTFQPASASRATRVADNIRDFTAGFDQMSVEQNNL